MSESTHKNHYDFDEILSNLRKTKTDKSDIVKELDKLRLQNKEYSDVISQSKSGEQLQWVNFVQEGGGTLGIALVGYAFVLEYVGIRFLRLAGTSAGAINTIFLAAIGEKEDPKTPELYRILTDDRRLSLKSFVDSKFGFVRSLLFSLGKGNGLINNLLMGFVALLFLVLIPLPLISFIGPEERFVYLLFLAIFLMITGFVVFLLVRLSKYNFGINPGAKFTSFLNKELSLQGVDSKADLDRKAKGEGDFEIETEKADKTFSAKLHAVVGGNKSDAPGAIRSRSLSKQDQPSTIKLSLRKDPDYVRIEQDSAYKNIRYDYSFVSTDICNQCKVVFPLDSDLYFDETEEIHPSEFVRASMAIPLFFEPKFFPGDPASQQNISNNCKSKWLKRKGIEPALVEEKGILIDGGSLSNFPINLFHNPEIKRPRMPAMGVRILSEKRKLKYNAAKRMSIGFFLGGIINTLRNNEDTAFLVANPFYKRFSIAEIEAFNANVNWLNFDLTKEDKDKLFTEGVKAAIRYLTKFNWSEYKEGRAKFNNPDT